jgi:hypothetical protein
MNLIHKAARNWFRPILFVLLAIAGYLIVSAWIDRVGFPLDDAWIHQTYARNLIRSGEWAFLPGRPSGGSTSPLWSLLLSVGYFFTQAVPYAWVYLLGGLCLFGLAIGGEAIFRQVLGEAKFPWVALFLAAEWHLVWAASSGMETALMGAVILGVFWLMGSNHPRWCWIGLAIGMSVWVRPDGLTLLGPALLLLGMRIDTVDLRVSWKERMRAFLFLAGGFLLVFLPYLFFNVRMEGSIWPNTFYAKQAEYAVLQEQSIWLRLASEYSLVLIGGGMILLPGFIFQAVSAVRKKDWTQIGMILWFLGYVGIYAWKLPVTYQHGRYIMPAMPVYFVCGLIGMAELLDRLRRIRRGRLIRRVWSLSLVGVCMGFYGIGAMQYAQDVAIIETEMVPAAQWVAANTNPDDLIAVHDIGAMGYYGKRNLIDLAGLASPEVIPIIRDEKELARYLDQKDVRYLVTFPDWYQSLGKDKAIVYQTQGKFSTAAGGANMVVYRWKVN